MSANIWAPVRERLTVEAGDFPDERLAPGAVEEWKCWQTPSSAAAFLGPAVSLTEEVWRHVARLEGYS